MSTLADIEAAIEKLSEEQVEALSRWLEGRRRSRTADFDEWLRNAVGAGQRGITTDEILTATRGEQ